MEEKKFGVYLVSNTVNGKVYVGKGTIRKDGKCSRWKRHANSRFAIGHAIRVHGWENFAFSWLETERSEYAAYELEKKWIHFYGSYGPERGYNENWGGDGGKQPTDATRAKISAAVKGKNTGSKRSEETKERMRAAAKARRDAGIPASRGWKRSEEAKEKTAAKHRGMKRSEVTCRKISESLKGSLPHNTGKKASPEQLRKMSENASTRRPEVKEKLRAAWVQRRLRSA